MIIVSFVISLLLFALVGALSMRKRKKSVGDYLLASRSIGPWLTALSSVVTNNSGYMFIGLIGYTYMQGVSAVWLSLGWMLGDYIAWHTVHPRLRRASELQPSNTLSQFLAGKGGKGHPLTAVIGGLVTLVFLTTYAAAQLSAGSKALHVLLDWPVDAGIFIGAGIVLLYSFAGGIRASIWTDAIQSVVMLLAMYLLLFICVREVGGMVSLLRQLEAIDPALVAWRPESLHFGFIAFFLGWLAAGFGVVGQPHILIRTMALRSTDLIKKTRRIYFAWYVPFTIAAVLVALYARILLPEVGEFDAELALPQLAKTFLPDILVGVVLAGLFAATISTADSQLLTGSGAITQDILPGIGQSYRMVKTGTLAITSVALVIALTANSTVFTLVIFSWSGLGAGLGPLLLGRLYYRPLSPASAVVVIITGVTTVVVWRSVLGFSDDVYELLPGFMAGLVAWFLCAGIEKVMAVLKLKQNR